MKVLRKPKNPKRLDSRDWVFEKKALGFRACGSGFMLEGIAGSRK